MRVQTTPEKATV